MKKSEWLAQLPDELIEARKRLFPVAAEFARAIGMTRQALNYREKNRYMGVGPDDLAIVYKVLEDRAEGRMI
ncbi:MAG: hypothetical protein F6K11_36200 [Leptolyngbya sp. SIO3F4]|nr:hypothetical protein [Leptolyngbya sp. SIO3F4]